MPTVFITAGAKNTGFAIAEKFAKEGFDIALSSRNDTEIKSAEKKLKEKYNVKIKEYILELTDLNNIKSVFSEIKKDFGSLDPFVANGVFYLGSDLSKTVTGTELTIDSGILNCLLPYKEMCK